MSPGAAVSTSLAKSLANSLAKWAAKWLGPSAVAWASHLRLASVGQALSDALRWLSGHTGVPAILVAAVLVVVSYRIAKGSLRFVAQVGLVLTVLAVLTKLGFLRF